MKEFIKKWFDIPTREELYERIDKQIMSRSAKHYAKLRKSDRDRYKEVMTQLEALQDNE